MPLNYTIERKFFPLGEEENPDVWIKCKSFTEEEITEYQGKSRLKNWREIMTDKLIEIHGVTFEGEPVTKERLISDSKLSPEIHMNVFSWLTEASYDLHPALKKKYGNMFSRVNQD